MNEWTVLSVARVVDGDTVVLTRQRLVGVADGLAMLARDIEPVRVRLVHVDTPERGEQGWAQARDDFADWVLARPIYARPLFLHVAGRDNFGRILGDLKTPDGDSASLHLIRDRGWPTWQETR